MKARVWARAAAGDFGHPGVWEPRQCEQFPVWAEGKRPEAGQEVPPEGL